VGKIGGASQADQLPARIINIVTAGALQTEARSGWRQIMLNATVKERVDHTKDLIFLRILPDAGVPDFLPGQYVALGLYEDHPLPDAPPDPVRKPKLVKRAYSIGSSPGEKGHVEFYFAIVPDGELTPRLDLLQPGDRLFMAPKITGTFTLGGVPDDAHLIFVATGTGIAPFMAMIRTPSTWAPGRRITILHGVRYVADLGYRTELEALAAEGKLRYIPVVSRADGTWSGERGHVQAQFGSQIILDAAQDHVFLCGNPAMVNEMEAKLLAQGFTEHSRKSPGNMHLEKYW
jgi:ferredoxin--NADP+ reductase